MNIVIFGAGVVGSQLAEILSDRAHDITVVERDPKRLAQLADRIDVRCLTGDVQSIRTLKESGCAEADLLLAVTSNDATNLLTASLSKQFGAKKVVARIRDKNLLAGWEDSYRSWFQIDLVLSPEELTAGEVAKRIGTAGFYVPMTLSHSNVAMQEWTIAEESPFLNRPLKDISEFTNIIIPCVFRQNQILIPSGNDRLQLRDRFFMVGAREDIRKIARKLHSSTTSTRTVMIFGGGDIGFTLARILENTRLKVKLVEPDESTCKFLSRYLEHTMVYHGSCLDENFLLEQGIQHIDHFVAVTPDEEDNLIASLVARELGAKSTVVLSERQEFVGIMKRIGVDTTVSPRLITANAILQFLDPGPLKTIIMLQENVAEVIQVTIRTNVKLIGRAIKDAGLPKGLIIAAVIRDGKVIVPHGNLVFMENDIAMIFTMRQNTEFFRKLVT